MGWQEELPEDIRDNKAFADIDSVENLAKQHIDHMQYRGNSLRLPDKDASADIMKEFYGKIIDKVPGMIPKPNKDDKEAMAALHKSMGVPEKASAYVVPEGKEYEGTSVVADLAHRNNLTQGQFEGLLSGLVDDVVEGVAKSSADFKKDMTDLKLDWGVRFEDNVDMAKAAINATKAPDDVKLLAADGKLDAETLRWLHGIAVQLGSEGINHAKDDDETTRVTPAEAKAQIDQIMSDREHAYWHPEMAGNKAAKDRINELHRAAYGGTG